MPQITESPEEIMARVLGRMPEITEEDVEQDRQRIFEDRESAEQTVPESGADSKLPRVSPMSHAEVRNYGTDGPHFVTLTKWIETGKTAVDDFGLETRERRQVSVKKMLSPYMVKDQILAVSHLRDIHPVTFQAAVCWSFQPGAETLDFELAAKTLNKQLPRTYINEMGEKVETTTLTPEMVQAEIVGGVQAPTPDNIGGLLDAVHLAFALHAPEVTRELLEECLSYGELTRILGKVLWLNAPLRDRFLA